MDLMIGFEQKHLTCHVVLFLVYKMRLNLPCLLVRPVVKIKCDSCRENTSLDEMMCPTQVKY
jgi:hypothetical protein